MTLNDFLSRLRKVKKNGAEYRALCPAHEDKQPSLSVTERDGKILVNCHTGNCSTAQIVAALGVELKDLFTQPLTPKIITAKPTIVAIYSYRDLQGKERYQRIRKSNKQFPQRQPNPQMPDGWQWNLQGIEQLPYKLPELHAALTANPAATIWFTEGEEDVHSLMRLGLTATSLKDWEFNQYLTPECHAVICLDHDVAGHNFARELWQKLDGAVATRRWLDLYDGTPLPSKHGPDVSDWLREGHTLTELLTLCEAAPLFPPEPDAAKPDTAQPADAPQPADAETQTLPTIADRYDMTPSGLYFVQTKMEEGKPRTKRTWLCEPLQVVALAHDTEQRAATRVVEFEGNGITHTLPIPNRWLNGEATECIELLLDCGLNMSLEKVEKRLLRNYLLQAKPERRALLLNQTGWHEGSYAWPDGPTHPTEAKDAPDILLPNLDKHANKFRVRGTLEDWRNNIARYCVGNSRLIFGVSAAFAACLLPLADEPAGGFHFQGTGGQGKSTALYVAGSVWGSGARHSGFIDTWRATANGLESLAESRNHALLCLDEISQANPHEVGEIIYALANGFGKSRMNKSLFASRQKEWQLLFLSTGEKTLETILQSVGKRLHSGQERRFVEVKADGGQNMGLFETLHEQDSPANLAKLLGEQSRQFYGTAARAFIQFVADQRDEVTETVKKWRKHWFDQIPKSTDGAVFSVVSRFALVAAAGELATIWGLTGWPEHTAWKVADRVFNEWLGERGTLGGLDARRGGQKVVSFLIQHGNTRFQSVHNSDGLSRVQNRVGFVDYTQEKNAVYYVLQQEFERELCAGFDHKAVAKWLHEHGHLLAGNEKGRLTAKHTLPEIGRQRVYAIQLSEKEATD